MIKKAYKTLLQWYDLVYEYDAISLASAEQGKVDVFLTTDDGIQKAADRDKPVFSFVVANPVRGLEEVLK